MAIDVTVMQHLYVFGMASVVLNSILAVTSFVAYIAIIVFYGLLSTYSLHDYSGGQFSVFAAVIESFSLLVTIVSTIFTLVGSCLGMVSNRKTGIAGIVSSVIAIWMLSTHFIINFLMMILTFMFDGFFIGINVSHVCGSLLVFILVFQFVLFIFNSVFIIVIWMSLRKEGE